MSNTIDWERPSGAPLQTNNTKDTIEYLESLGFKQIKAAPKK